MPKQNFLPISLYIGIDRPNVKNFGEGCEPWRAGDSELMTYCVPGIINPSSSSLR